MKIIEMSDADYDQAPIGSVVRVGDKTAIVTPAKMQSCKKCICLDQQKCASFGTKDHPTCVREHRIDNINVIFKAVHIHNANTHGIFYPKEGQVFWYEGRRYKTIGNDRNECLECAFRNELTGKRCTQIPITCSQLIFKDITGDKSQ